MADPIKWTPELKAKVTRTICVELGHDPDDGNNHGPNTDAFEHVTAAVLAVVGEAMLSKEAHAQGFNALYGGDGLSPTVTAVLRAAMEAAR